MRLTEKRECVRGTIRNEPEGRLIELEDGIRIRDVGMFNSIL